MKKLSIVLYLLLSFQLFASDGLSELIEEQEVAKKRLEELGYTKWKRALDLLNDALVDEQTTSFEAVVLERRVKELKLEYLKSKVEQKKILYKLAVEDLEKLEAKAQEFKAVNDKVEQNLKKGEKDLKLLQDLLARKKNVVKILEAAEVDLKIEMDVNREQIDSLIDQWTLLDKKIKEIDEQNQKE